jgi:hypothetical protein
MTAARQPIHRASRVIPGANMLRQLPMLDMLAMASVSVAAPTVMLLGALAGDMVQLSPPLLFPAFPARHRTLCGPHGEFTDAETS